MRADNAPVAGARSNEPREPVLAHTDAKAGVMGVLDTLTPMLDVLLADPEISGEHAMHLVVMDPAVDAATASFDDAILAERSYGDVANWKADYAWYARAKTRLAWREQMSLRTLFAHHPARLRDGELGNGTLDVHDSFVRVKDPR